MTMPPHRRSRRRAPDAPHARRRPARPALARPALRDEAPQATLRLSDEERAAAARHVPLVYLHLRRQLGVSRRGMTDREFDDLFQEGCIALMRCVRTHDPCRHGSFAAYAMARIHHAVSQTLRERDGGIRVPMSSQRRRRVRAADRHDPAPPREQHFRDAVTDDNLRRFSTRRDPTDAPPDACRIAHLARDRFAAAARAVAAELAAEPAARSGRAELIADCLNERWLVARPEYRTSLRDIAARHRCSLGRVTHCDTEFKRRVEQSLRADPQAAWLLARAVEHQDGFDRALGDTELAAYQAAAGLAPD